MRRKANPIYNLLARVSQSNLQELQALKQILQHKRDRQDKPYFLIPLSITELTPLTLRQNQYEIREHHISAYQNCNEKQFGFTAFHYTATLQAGQVTAKLHVYFDRNQRFCDCLLQQGGDTIMLSFETENALQQLSRSHMAPAIELVLNAYSLFEAAAEIELQKLRKETQALSRQLFASGQLYAADGTIREKYLQKIDDYIEAQQLFNQIALQPDHAIIKCLTKAREFVSNITPKAPKTQIPAATKQKKTSTHTVKPSVKPKATQTLPSAPVVTEKKEKFTAVKGELAKLKQLHRPSVSDLCHWHQKLSQAIRLTPDSEPTFLLDCAIEQQNVVALACKRMMLSAALGIIDEVRQLMTIAPVTMDTVAHTAVREERLAILQELLAAYCGPKIFFYENFNIMFSSKLPVTSAVKLLEFGLNPCARNIEGFTLLHHASVRTDLNWIKQKKLIDALLHHGADINARQQSVSIASAQHSSNPQLSSSVLTSITDPEVVSSLNTVFSKVLSYRTQALSFFCGTGATPVMSAAEVSNLAAVKLLLKRGANHRLTTSTGHDVFAIATIMSPGKKGAFNQALVQYLIEHCGFNINSCVYSSIQGSVMLSPLQAAVLTQRADYLVGLLQCGANPSIPELYQPLTAKQLPLSPIRMTYEAIGKIETPLEQASLSLLILIAQHTLPDIVLKKDGQTILSAVRERLLPFTLAGNNSEPTGPVKK